VLEHGGDLTEVLHAGGVGIGGSAQLPSRHAEKFIEAIANIYAGLAAAIDGEAGLIDAEVPGVDAGLRSMTFVDAALQSSADREWRALTVET